MTTIPDDALAPPPTDRMSATDDQRIDRITPLPPPANLIRFFPITGTPAETFIMETRERIRDILRGASDRLLVVIGPCSIHDPDSALEYATRLKALRIQWADELELVMRVYFEKPRTSIGWKGLINDPYLNGSFRINEGLRIARDLLVRINQMGVPAGCEFLDVISPQYIGDLVAWGAIGARTTESQVHRELASGLSSTVGFKNGTDGNVQIAIAAIQAAAERHHFLSVHKSGQVAIVETAGNPDCHVILRGGQTPNIDAAHIDAVCAALRQADLPERLMIDLSHGNAPQGYAQQMDNGRALAQQIEAGETRIIGVTAESHLVAGKQSLSTDQPLVYGQSITDPCMGWAETADLLQQWAAAVRARRARAQ